MARAVKLDEQLASAVREAHEALVPLVPAGSVGEHLGAVADADRLVTHRFEATVTGYRGWEWYVTLGRASRSKVVTVCESGLLPGEDALLSPAWVPWADRMSVAELEAVQGHTEDGEFPGITSEDAAADAAAEAPAEQGAAEAAEAASQGSEAAEEEQAHDAAHDDSDEAEGDADDTDESEEAAPAAAGRQAPRRRRRRRR